VHTARVRLISLYINDKEYDTALTALNVKSQGGYAGIYEELRGDALLAKGDTSSANAAYNMALQSDGLSTANRDIITGKLADTNAASMKKPEMVK
jgi:predicted negative regulator of RcsB-dependent stress response